MHRHGYKGRKLGRKRDQRRALIRNLATALFEYESVETTYQKAKELVPYAERQITKAKKGDLHNRRQVIAALDTVEAAHKLVDDIAPKLSSRNSGHLRIEKTRLRRGDNAQMARVSFVDSLEKKPESAKPNKTAKVPAKSAKSKPAQNKQSKAKAQVATKENT